MKTLADKAQAALAAPWHWFPVGSKARRVVEPGFIKLRSRLRAARRFRLNNDFLSEVVHQASVQPAVIRRMAVLANLPFDDVWLEWDQEHRVRLQERLGTSEPLLDGDRGLGGYLLCRDSVAGERVPDRWHAHPFASGRDEADEAEMGAYCQVRIPIDPQGDEPEPPQEIDETVISGWGYRPGSLGSPSDPSSTYRSLLAIGGTSPGVHTILPIMPLEPSLWRAYTSGALEARGDLRFLITVLAMLNSVPIRYVHEAAPAGRFTRRLNSMAYLDSHTVELHVGRAKVVRLLERASREASRKRRHEVRGSWALAEYGNGHAGCRHLPVDDPALNDGRHALCAKCGSLIVWRDHHMRGDASLGFVQKEYEVSR